ncbi:MAG: sialate O-acetylesterase, partial [Verrucomicrobiales bacterium]
MNTRQLLCIATATAALLAAASLAEGKTRLPSIISSNMVLQRDMELPIWGWDNPGQKVLVEIAGQKHQATAAKDGKWSVTLQPLSSCGNPKPLTMEVNGSSTVKVRNILVGEVWLCSGQSNMAFAVSSANDSDLETATAKFPKIRLISVPQVGTQKIQDDFEGKWARCTPESVADFSAVGYFFGRRLHQTLDVPIGLIDNAWGGSAAEAWVRRDVLKKNPFFKPLIDKWIQTEKTFDMDKANAEHAKRVAAWKKSAAKAKTEGKPAPVRPRAPRDPLVGQHRPGNLYAGVLHPIIPFGIRGAIWYQGESNASRAWEYRKLFPLMIQHWRDEWGQGNFPFYWVQLADFRSQVDEPAESQWAELREAQTRTMSELENTGEVVILNLGEASDIHPKNKQDVAKRLARWALAREYGLELVHHSPSYKSMENKGAKIMLSFDHVGSGLDTFDIREPVGFAIAGPDKHFVWADAKIIGTDKVEVWSTGVPDPVAVRYAWAENPVCNLQNREGLPATPFRTDDFAMITNPATAASKAQSAAPAAKPTPPKAPKPAAKPAAKPAPKPAAKPAPKTPAKKT